MSSLETQWYGLLSEFKSPFPIVVTIKFKRITNSFLYKWMQEHICFLAIVLQWYFEFHDWDYISVYDDGRIKPYVLSIPFYIILFLFIKIIA